MRGTNKIIRVILLIIAIVFIELSVNKVFAVDLSISASKTTIGNKETATITVSSQYTGRVNLTVSGGTISNSKLWLENGSGTVTVTANSDNGVKVTATPAGLVDGSGNAVSVGAKSVSIAKKATTNNNNNNNNNGNNTAKPEQPQEKEPTFKSANEKMYATGNINVRKSYSADSDKLGSLQTGDEVTRIGVGDNGWSKVSFNGGTGYIKSNLLTAEEPKKSEDKALKSLTIEGIEGVELTPAFNAEVTEYSVIVGKGVDKVDIKAEASDEKAKVDIANVEKIIEGDNLIKIVVTAEDGTARTYSVNVKKQEEKAIGLSSLKVQGYTIEPRFSADVFEYKLTVLDPKVTSLEIVPEANTQNAKIEVTGNTNLKQGENTVLINVTSEDGKDKATYKIVVNKTAVVAGTTNQNNMILYGGIGVIGLLVVAIIIVIVVAKRKSRYEEEEYEEDYEDLYGYSTRNEPAVVKESNINNNAQSDKKNIEEELFGKVPGQNENGNTMNNSEFNYNSYTEENLYNGIDNCKGNISNKYNISSNESNNYPGKKFDYSDMKLEYSFDNISTNKSYSQYKDDNLFGRVDVPDANNDEVNFNKYKKADTDAYNNGNYFSGNSSLDNFYSSNTNNEVSNDNYNLNEEMILPNKSDEWNFDDEYKPRKSRGKHSK